MFSVTSIRLNTSDIPYQSISTPRECARSQRKTTSGVCWKERTVVCRAFVFSIYLLLMHLVAGCCGRSIVESSHDTIGLSCHITRTDRRGIPEEIKVTYMNKANKRIRLGLPVPMYSFKPSDDDKIDGPLPQLGIRLLTTSGRDKTAWQIETNAVLSLSRKTAPLEIVSLSSGEGIDMVYNLAEFYMFGTCGPMGKPVLSDFDYGTNVVYMAVQYFPDIQQAWMPVVTSNVMFKASYPDWVFRTLDEAFTNDYSELNGAEDGVVGGTPSSTNTAVSAGNRVGVHLFSPTNSP